MAKADRVDEAFPTTAWEHVRAAPADHAALAGLLGIYHGPLVAYLTCKGVSSADAEDTVQQFFVDRVFESATFFPQADPARGRFRALLRVSVWRYWIDQVRTSRSGREGPNRGVPLPEELAATSKVDQDDAGGETFDVAIGLRLFSLALQRLRESCTETPGFWGVFEGRVLAPLMGGRSTPYGALARAYGFKTDKQAANAFQTTHNRFRRLWSEVLIEHFGDHASGEGDDLIGALRRAGPELLTSLRGLMAESLPQVSSAGEQFGISPEVLAMLHPQGGPSRDPGEALRHLLSTPLWLDAVSAATASPASSVGDGVVLESLAVLLRHPDPCLPYLEGVKEYAKSHRIDPDSEYSPLAASVLYFISIARALERYDARISDLDGSRLQAGLLWVASQNWVDEEWQSLATRAIAKLSDA